ncbi:23S rRNA pseudouridine2605 synthase [Mucilaginibacter yixingensis]|uniref:Pseudouridine synthase n=1 Tax=Mucilaginibacter yixingensis TaxID=1295612 RepID=A0A2T5JCR4_9SPHI|nr:pseudouridine synthase [Mucilaginibacter yixingensis]PTQ99550.1 23S rRNA pseudouridine2605 synthase [Mucilaginibacter yixingensis]
MVFRKPGNSRDDKSAKPAARRTGGDSPRRPSPSPARGRSAAAPGGGAGKPSGNRSFGKRQEGDQSEGKRSFSASRPKTSSGGFSRGDKPAGEGRGSFGDRPKRNFSSDAPSDRKFSKPFNKGGFDKRSEGGDRPFSKGGFNKRSEGGDRPFNKGGFNKRSEGGDRPFNKGGFDRRNEGGDRPFNKGGFDRRNERSDRPYNKEGFDRRNEGGDFADRRERNRDFSRSYDSDREQPAPERVMRSRKKGGKKEEDSLIRLNRYISNAGICSRRKADELISAGVVSVNGEVVSELGFKVDPAKDVVRYNGETLKREKMVYVLLNKPKDYITTTDDPQERRTVMHLVEKASRERIYPVGRLDRNTTGLLLMTNDGDLADKLSHPRNNITKLYQAELNKNLTQGDLNKIQFGLELEDGFIKPDMVSYVAGASKKEIGIQIHSGKNRIVRRIFEHLGYEVTKLDRSIYANLTKKDLPRGRWRFLEEHEIIQLKHLIK